MTIKFDGVDLGLATYLTRYAQHETPARKIQHLTNISGGNGTILTSNYLGEKEIRLEGVINDSTIADLEEKIDEFKELFNRAEKILEISWGGTTRKYIATCREQDFSRDFFNDLYVPWRAVFVVPSGVGYEDGEKDVIEATINNGFYEKTDLEFGGSAEPKPIIRITIGTSVPGKHTQIAIEGNDSSALMIKANRTTDAVLTADDVFELDCANKTLKFNTVEQEKNSTWYFYGNFPRFKAGENNTVRITIGNIQSESNDILPSVISGFRVYNSSFPTDGWHPHAIGQLFSVNNTDVSFTKLAIYCRKVGTPTGNYVLSLRTPSAVADEPSLTSIYNSSVFGGEWCTYNFDVSTVSTDWGWHIITLGNYPVELKGSKPYYFVITQGGTNNATNYLEVGKLTCPNQYDIEYRKGKLLVYNNMTPPADPDEGYSWKSMASYYGEPIVDTSFFRFYVGADRITDNANLKITNINRFL